MDVNDYMKRSIELQERQVTLLEEISAKLGGTETVTLRVDAKAAADAVREVVQEAKADVAKQEATKPGPANGSTKQAANHAKGDAKQEEAKPKKLTADDVRAALMELGKAQGSEASIALLKKYDSTSVSGLDADNYAALIDDARAAIKGE